MKLNTDGAFKANSDMASARGIVRNEYRNSISRFALNKGPDLSILAEL